MSSADDLYHQLVKRFDTTAFGEFRGAAEELFADDIVWANTGLPTAEGKEAALAFLDSFNQSLGVQGLRIETIAAASTGNTVVTERIDHLLLADGTAAASIPLAGTFEFAGGKLKAWRDYFDPRPLLPPG